MSKQFIREIEACWQCPLRRTDQNVTRWICGHEMCGVHGKFICWMGDGEDTILAEWCPLPDKELEPFIEKKEMEI